METIDIFLEGLKNVPALWKSIDVRGIALRVGEEWHNTITTCRLRSVPPEHLTPIDPLPETSRLKCWNEIVPMEDIGRLLTGLRDGSIDLAGVLVQYQRQFGRDSIPTEPYRASVTLERIGSGPGLLLDPAWVPAQALTWPTIVLRAFGGEFDELMRDIPRSQRDLNSEIHALAVPYDGFEGIARHVIGLRPNRGMGAWPDILPNYSTFFYMSAPLEARFDSGGTRLHGGELEVRLQMGSQLVAEHTSVGCIFERDDELLRTETIQFGDPSCTWNTDDCVLTASLNVLGATSAVLLLRVGNRPVERIQLSDYTRPARNSRVIAYSSVDLDLAILRKGLDPSDRSDAAAFERAVARLFTLLGFQTASFANDKKLSDAMDLLAFNPYGEHVFAVECTTGALDAGGKLGKLHLRTSDLSDQLKEHAVRAILVTASERHTLSIAEIEKAAQDRIAVLAAEDLKDLLRLASDGVPMPTVLSFVTARIPKVPQPGGLLGQRTGGIRRSR